MVAQSDGSHAGHILVVEDDPDLRDLLRQLLQDEGYQVDVAPNGQGAVDKVVDGSFRPDMVVADYNLPGGMTGLQVADQAAREPAGPPGHHPDRRHLVSNSVRT